MKSMEIRQKFFDFFKRMGHTHVPSSSLIPAQDSTLLFTNAGMNQFKDLFLGKEKRKYTRAMSIQKCVRAGGKHNDLDQVGFTARHMTFFEMMGNFSFGDYFKKEAIEYAWEFFTKDMGMDPDKLYATVFTDDDEAYNHWVNDVGMPKERVSRLGEKDNFWRMGDTGPCGPCSEIYYDFGSKAGCGKKSCVPGCECDRFTEVWNLVFMQYDCQADGTLKPLKKKSIDTGMGFERLCVIMQGKDSVYQTDLITPLIARLEKLTGVNYKKSTEEILSAFHVLCDHVRSSCLLIADGCSPSNEGRGYVLRKIIRRAALFAQKLTDDQSVFASLGRTFIEQMAPVYPELKKSETLIIDVLSKEIERFTTNLIQGLRMFDKYAEELGAAKKKMLSGAQIFKLYDTYGFPPELTRVMAQEKGLALDEIGFEKEMGQQQTRSRACGKEEVGDLPQIPDDIHTKFVGYDELETKSDIAFVCKSDTHAWIVTAESPFYVESGGQVGDIGWVMINDHTYPVTRLHKEGVGDNPAVAVQISLISKESKTGEIAVGDLAHCVVDYYKRVNTMKNHTATHLLQAALVQVVGGHVKQAGSFVNDEHLRFDYAHHEALTPDQIEQVEQIVNQKIQENIELKVFTTTLERAKDAGVIAFFGEKYNPENVRVVQVPGFSAELCGGTHVVRTGDIGCFKITQDMALATGTRRILAVTGPVAIKQFQQIFCIVKKLSEQYKAKPEQVFTAICKQCEDLKCALSNIKQLKKQSWKSLIPQWQEQVVPVGNVPFLFLGLEDFGNDDLKNIALEIEKKSPGMYFLVSHSAADAKRINFFAYVSKAHSKEVDLKKMASVLKDHGLRGGGSTTLMQGGGVDIDVKNIEQVVREWVITA